MKKPFYGWYISGAGCLGNLVQGGFVFYAIGMYASVFEDVFDESRARIAIIETCLTLGVNLLSPILGMWVDKKSPRHAMALGAVSLGTGLILISQVGALFHAWILFATLVPLGALSLGMLPSSAMLSRWFRRRRGLALGISLAGTSIGGAVAPPLLALLFDALGWRTALVAVGSAIILLAPILFLIVRNQPSDLGLEAEPAGPAAPQSDEMADWAMPQLLKTPAMYLQALYSGMLLAVFFGLLTHLGFHMKDLGFTPTQTGFLYSVIAACSFGGKIVFGTLADKLGPRRGGLLAVSCIASGLLTFLAVKDYSFLLIAAALVGLGAGGNTPVWTSLIARDFGPRSFGRALGLQSPMHIPITAPAPPLAGLIADKTGSYELVFILYLVMAALAMFALVLLRRPPRQPHSETAVS